MIIEKTTNLSYVANVGGTANSGDPASVGHILGAVDDTNDGDAVTAAESNNDIDVVNVGNVVNAGGETVGDSVIAVDATVIDNTTKSGETENDENIV